MKTIISEQSVELRVLSYNKNFELNDDKFYIKNTVQIKDVGEKSLDIINGLNESFMDDMLFIDNMIIKIDTDIIEEIDEETGLVKLKDGTIVKGICGCEKYHEIYVSSYYVLEMCMISLEKFINEHKKELNEIGEYEIIMTVNNENNDECYTKIIDNR